MKLEPFEKHIYLSSPTMHGEELKYMTEAYETNWMSTIGENIGEVERQIAAMYGVRYAVALGTGTAAVHMCVRMAGVKPGDRAFCSDLTFSATANPICYEGGRPIFIDSETDTWNMDPEALEKAFERYPDVKVCVVADLYGTPAKLDQLRSICDAHGAVLVEDAAEAVGSTYHGRYAGTYGTFNAISFNGNKIITGTSGGMVLTDNKDVADRIRKWSTQSRESTAWYQHTELGFNYRISNVVAGVIRGQLPHLEEHISQKKAIYMRYKENLSDLPVRMNPFIPDEMEPNFWLSCLVIDREAMCPQVRTDTSAVYTSQKGKTCPTEILDTIRSINAEGRPLWKPMHMQPFYKDDPFVSLRDDASRSVNSDLFERGVCLPSDNKMTMEQVDRISLAVRSCFE